MKRGRLAGVSVLALGASLAAPLLTAGLPVAVDPVAAPPAPSPVTTPSGLELRIEFDDRLWSWLVATTAAGDVPLGERRPSEWVVVDGRVIDRFARAPDPPPVAVHDELGHGRRTEVSGTAGALVKRVAITRYDAAPALLIVETRYTNRGGGDLTISRAVERRTLAARPRDPGPPFWSYQSGSYPRRPDWILPLRPGFAQRNFLGMNATDYGGGPALIDVWRRDLGLALGHLAPIPRAVALPVAMTAAGAELGLEEDLARTLHPGESVTPLPAFILLHTGDHFTSLATYRALMIRRGMRFPTFGDSAYQPIWCGWGYGRKGTPAQFRATLAKAAALGFKWAVLDDGWQTNEGDWQLDPRKFPGGDADMRALTDDVRRAGMRPMLWWTPLAADPGTALLREHPDQLLLDARGRPRRITWWNSYYLCPAYQPVRAASRALLTKMMTTWGFDGVKLDGQHLNAAPPCENPAHHHARPSDSSEAMPTFFATLFETAHQLVRDPIVELCPCGTSYALHTLPFFDLPAASDPESSWQVRLKGKTLKALLGPDAPYYGDHVELSDHGDDFASTVGVGGVIGSQFTLPGNGPSETKYQLTPAREALWRKWLAIAADKQLARGQYLGGLYDIGFDRPESHAIRKEGRLYYAFFAPRFHGPVELRGLEPGGYCVRDYVGGINLGLVHGPTATLPVSFTRHLLLEATPAAACPP